MNLSQDELAASGGVDLVSGTANGVRLDSFSWRAAHGHPYMTLFVIKNCVFPMEIWLVLPDIECGTNCQLLGVHTHAHESN